MLLSMTAAADSLPLDDTSVKTDDGKCAIHYLTQRNVTGWRLDAGQTSCPDGWIDGYADVTIRDAFGQPAEQIYGFFKQGYWTGKYRIDAPVIDRFSTEQGVQSLSFDLGNDPQFDIRFIGQMKSNRAADGSYSAFEACSPVRILAVTDRISLFEDESSQQDLLNTVIQKAHSVCPDAHLIYFFGAEKNRPNKDEIVFFADLDLAQKQIRVRRLPSSPRLTEQEAAARAASDAPLPKVIRHEGGTPLMRVTPIRPLSLTDQSTDAQTPPPSAAVVTPTLPEAPAPEQTKRPETSPVHLTSLQPESAAASSPAEPEPPEPITSPNPVTTPDEPSLDEVSHLLTASRLLGQPVTGRTAVHVRRVDLSGIAWIDDPVPMRAAGRLLPIGWNIVEGAFSATSPTSQADASEGLIQIKTARPCPESGCFTVTGDPL